MLYLKKNNDSLWIKKKNTFCNLKKKKKKKKKNFKKKFKKKKKKKI